MPDPNQELFEENLQIFDYLKHSRLFGHLQDAMLKKLVPLSKFLDIPAGTIILKEGEMNDQVYFLINGTVSIHSKNEEILRLRRIGDIFGEISIISNAPCTATVIADENVQLFGLEAKAVGQYSDLNPQELQNSLYRIFAKILTEKLFLTTEKARQFEKTNKLLHDTQKNLEEAHATLKMAHEKLEARVEERTKDLLIANRQLQQEIIERKRLEADQKQLELKLRHAHKMEAVGTLAGGIAHEFNNLLQGMFIGMDMLDYNLPADDAMRMPLDNARKFGERAKELVQQILAFSHQDDGERDLINIIPVVEKVLLLIRSSLPSTIDLEANIEESQPSVYGNEIQVQQMLVNLCKNAEYAMKDNGGVLEFTLKTVDIPSEKIHAMQIPKPGKYVSITIGDSGCGISPDIKDRIFDPFFTTKPVGEGSGLGLSIVHGLITSFGGGIVWETELGKGSSFEILLPVD